MPLPSASYAAKSLNSYFQPVALLTSCVAITVPFCSKIYFNHFRTIFRVIVFPCFRSFYFCFAYFCICDVITIYFCLISVLLLVLSLHTCMPLRLHRMLGAFQMYISSLLPLLTSFVSITLPFCSKSTLIISGRSFALSSFHVFVPSTFVCLLLYL